jgi:hypothetical protein
MIRILKRRLHFQGATSPHRVNNKTKADSSSLHGALHNLKALIGKFLTVVAKIQIRLKTVGYRLLH